MLSCSHALMQLVRYSLWRRRARASRRGLAGRSVRAAFARPVSRQQPSACALSGTASACALLGAVLCVARERAEVLCCVLPGRELRRVLFPPSWLPVTACDPRRWTLLSPLLSLRSCSACSLTRCCLPPLYLVQTSRGGDGGGQKGHALGGPGASMLHNFHGLEDTTSSWAPDEFVFSPQVCLLSFFLGSAAGVACPCAPVHAACVPALVHAAHTGAPLARLLVALVVLLAAARGCHQCRVLHALHESFSVEVSGRGGRQRLTTCAPCSTMAGECRGQ